MKYYDVLPTTIKEQNAEFKDRKFNTRFVNRKYKTRDGKMASYVMRPNSLANIIPTPLDRKKCIRTGCLAWARKDFMRQGYRVCSRTHKSWVRKTSKGDYVQDILVSDIRQVYKGVLGDSLSTIFDSVAQEEAERINVAAEVDLSRMTVVETLRAVSAIIEKTEKQGSRIVALECMRKAIKTHMELVNQYLGIADKAAIATPERMRQFFDQLKMSLATALVPEEDPTDCELFNKVMSVIETTPIPKGNEAKKVEITIS